MKKFTKIHLIYGSFLFLLALFMIFDYVHTQNLITSTSAEISTQINHLNQNIESLEQKDQQFEQTLGMVQGDVSSLSTKLEEKDLQILTLTEDLSKIQTQSEQLEEKITSLKAQNQDFSEVIENSIPAVVSVRTNSGSGSGFFISSDGNIVTNYHVIAGATAAIIITADGEQHAVTLLGYSKNADIALLDIDGDNFPPLRFGDSDDARVGQAAIAIGNPGGFDFTVTQGIISAHRTDSKGNELLQIDVPINPGNSGGPLFDANGDVLGVTTSKIQGFEGVGFALASNYVDDIIDEIKAEP